MPEVGAAVEQLLHGYNSHVGYVLLGCRLSSGDRVKPDPGTCAHTNPQDGTNWHARASAPRKPTGGDTAEQAREVNPLTRIALLSLHTAGC
jgi:hypothetical protein